MKYFSTLSGKKLPLPLFFPDATRAVLRTLDTKDIISTKTPGILVNTYHLINQPGLKVINTFGGIKPFMNSKLAIISDSGGFQVGSIAKKEGSASKITDHGVYFKLENQPKQCLTPEDSIRFQLSLKTDLIVVLDDFTPPNATRNDARISVERTLLWAKRSKDEFMKRSHLTSGETSNSRKPYLIGVVQGGFFPDLREYCTKELVKIGFDGLGFGGWPLAPTALGVNLSKISKNLSSEQAIRLRSRQDTLAPTALGINDTQDYENNKTKFDYESAKIIAKNAPESYLLYGLGIGKPENIVALSKMGYSIFDCVLPTRDARHGRLYCFTAASREKINLNNPDFYNYFNPTKLQYALDKSSVSPICDCLLCKNYSRGYLNHLFKIGDPAAFRLATLHNLSFYACLMRLLRKNND